MPSLSSEQLSILDAHVNAGDRIAYYTQLAEWGDQYAALCLGVVNNDTWAGATANIFFLQEVAENGGPQPFGWDNLAAMSLDLMRADFEARQTGGLDLSVDVIWGYHTEVFANYDAPANAWTPSFALSSLATVEEREALWDSFLAIGAVSGSAGDWYDLFTTSLSSSIAGYDDYIADVAGAAALGLTAPSTDYGPFSVGLGGGGSVVGGNDESNTLAGTANGDVLIGFDNNDVLSGSVGADRLYGGTGEDALIGGSVASGFDPFDVDLRSDNSSWDDGVRDELKGGTGRDRYLLFKDNSETFQNLQDALQSIDVIDERSGDGVGDIDITLGSQSNLGQFYEEIQVKGDYEVNYSNANGTYYMLKEGEFAEDYDWIVSILVSTIPDEDGNPYVFLLSTYPHAGSPIAVIKGFRDGDFGVHLDGYAGPREGTDGDDRALNQGGGASRSAANAASNVNDVVLDSAPETDQRIDMAGGKDIAYGRGGDDEMRGGTGDDQLFGGEGNDRVQGGHGADALDGATGGDTYVYALGDGVDIIEDWGDASSNDVIELRSGIATGSVTIGRGDADFWDLRLGFSDGGSITVKAGFIGAGTVIEAVRFAGGTTWTASDIRAMYLDQQATSGNDYIHGFIDTADIIAGREGNDELYGYTGDDTLNGNEGNDVLFGNEGADRLIGEAGDDFMIGGADGDVFAFGSTSEGTDWIDDFVAGQDRIDLSAIAGIDDFADVLAIAQEWGGTTWLNFNQSNSIRLQNVSLASLSAGDFILA